MKLKVLTVYAEQFNRLQQRERILVAALLVSAIVLFLYISFIEPAIIQISNMEKQLADLKVQIKASDTQIVALEKVLTQDPDAESRNQLARLKQQQKQINEKLKEKMTGLIEPAQMAQVLEAVVSKTSYLRLEKLSNLPTRPLTDGAEGDATEISDSGVYQHGLQIELRGSYLNMLEYLQILKTLPWEFYWDSLDLQVKKYPETHIVIKVHTLSFKEGWIGV